MWSLRIEAEGDGWMGREHSHYEGVGINQCMLLELAMYVYGQLCYAEVPMVQYSGIQDYLFPLGVNGPENVNGVFMWCVMFTG
ncbi:hypothetical protein E2C01_057589 [Portunus trituberculatus]|uniref:Uncharacterized protein n=1 Tax=Portunus trituberculatus TaxID=210409 RepID=A0A5B7GTC0_PORTR|nr:hypothetical protein [Portunus trituberculatus]